MPWLHAKPEQQPALYRPGADPESLLSDYEDAGDEITGVIGPDGRWHYTVNGEEKERP